MASSSPPGMPRRTRWLIWSVFGAVWTLLLLVTIPESGPIAELPEERRALLAKFTHVAVYGFWTILSAWLQAPARWRWTLVFVLMAHASVTELLQTQVDRGGSLGDVVWDHLGVGLGLLVTWKWWTRGS